MKAFSSCNFEVHLSYSACGSVHNGLSSSKVHRSWCSQHEDLDTQQHLTGSKAYTWFVHVHNVHYRNDETKRLRLGVECGTFCRFTVLFDLVFTGIRFLRDLPNEKK